VLSISHADCSFLVEFLFTALIACQRVHKSPLKNLKMAAARIQDDTFMDDSDDQW
jgi:hypothetical protein